MKQIVTGFFLMLSVSFCGAMHRVKITRYERTQFASASGAAKAMRDRYQKGTVLYQNRDNKVERLLIASRSTNLKLAEKNYLSDFTNRIVPKELNFDEDDQ